MKQNLGILAGILSTIFLGTSIVIVSVLSKQISPIPLSFMAYLTAIPFMTIFALMQKFQLKQLFSRFRKDFTQLLILRTIIAQLLLLYGLSITLAIRAAFITRFELVFVFIFSIILLKEKVRIHKIVLIILLLFGAFLFTTSGNISIFNSLLLGDLFIIISMAFLAYTYLPSAKIIKQINIPSLLLPLYILAVIILLPAVLIFFPTELAITMDKFYLLLTYVIVFHTFGLSLWYLALKTVKPWVVAAMLSLTPLISSLLAFFWLGQILFPVQMIGGAMIIVSTFFIGRENRKE